MDLNEMMVFTQVVKAGSFSAAGRRLGMPKSTVSRKVAALEAQLGVRLLQRTTRKLNLTDAGRTYHQFCARIASEIEEATQAVTSMQGAPRGLLRVTTPLSSPSLGTLAAQFLEQYPEVQLEVICTDRVIDIVEEGFDVAIRMGRLADSSLIARSLGQSHGIIVAGADYVRRRGMPAIPADLEHHDCIVFGAGDKRLRWKLESKTGSIGVKVRSRLVINDMEMIEAATLAGHGVAMLQWNRCRDAIASGRLRRILPEWHGSQIPMHAVYPSTRHLSPKVRVFLDFLQARIN